MEIKFVFSFPFDWRTPRGFLAANLFEAITGSLAAELYFDTLALIGGFCLYAMEFVADLNAILRDLNNVIEGGENRKITQAEYMEMQIKFNEILRFHSEVIELSRTESFEYWNENTKNGNRFSFRFWNRFADLNSSAIFSYFMYAILSFGSVFLQINLVYRVAGFLNVEVFGSGLNFQFFLLASRGWWCYGHNYFPISIDDGAILAILFLRFWWQCNESIFGY